jgi:hypothetical protein
VASLGHRLMLADLMLGFFFGWAEQIETIRHEGEKVYRIPMEHEDALVFFIRRGSVFFTSDVETSRRALDRLNRASADTRETVALRRGDNSTSPSRWSVRSASRTGLRDTSSS